MAINPNDPAVNLEPGVMGETEPPEQKILDHLNTIATGYFLGKMGGSAAEALIGKIGSKLSEAGQTGNVLDTIHQMAGLTPEESTVVKNIPDVQVYVKGIQKGFAGKPDFPIYDVKGAPEEISKLGYGPDPGSIPQEVLEKAGLKLPAASPSGEKSLEAMQLRKMWGEIAEEQSGTSKQATGHFTNPENFTPAKRLFSLGLGFPLSQQNQSVLQSVKDKLTNYKDSKYGR